MPQTTLPSQSLQKTMLLLIDVQSAFETSSTYFGTERSNPKLHTNIASILRTFRAAAASSSQSTSSTSKGSVPLIAHIYHASTEKDSPLHPSNPGMKFLPYAEPQGQEFVDSKKVNSAFIGTGLEDHIRRNGVEELFICGLTMEHCVSTSTRMAANLGVVDVEGEGGEVRKGRAVLIEDATAAYSIGDLSADIVHRVNVASLEGEFAEVMTVDQVIREISSRL